MGFTRSERPSFQIIPFRNEVVVKVLIWGEGGSGWKLGDVDRLWCADSGGGGGVAGAGAHRARTGRGGSAPTALAVEERFRTQLGRRGGGAGLQRAAGAALVGLLCRGRSGGAGSAAPAWRQPRADQCCGLGGAKRPPARRRDRAAEGRAGLSARAVGDCLLPGCALKALPASQGQTQDGPAAPPPRRCRRPGGVQKISSAPRLKRVGCPASLPSTKRASGSRCGIIGAGAPLARVRPGSMRIAISGFGSMPPWSRSAARVWCCFCPIPTAPAWPPSWRPFAKRCPRGRSVWCSTAAAAMAALGCAGRRGCNRSGCRAIAPSSILPSAGSRRCAKRSPIASSTTSRSSSRCRPRPCSPIGTIPPSWLGSPAILGGSMLSTTLRHHEIETVSVAGRRQGRHPGAGRLQGNDKDEGIDLAVAAGPRPPVRRVELGLRRLLSVSAEADAADQAFVPPFLFRYAGQRQRVNREGADPRGLNAGIESIAAPAAPSGAAAAIPVLRDLDLDIDLLAGGDGDIGELVDVASLRIDRDMVFAGRDVAVERSAGLGDADDPAVEADIGRRQADIGLVIAIDPDAGVAARRAGGSGHTGSRRAYPAERGKQQDYAAKPQHGGRGFLALSPLNRCCKAAARRSRRRRPAEIARGYRRCRGTSRRLWRRRRNPSISRPRPRYRPSARGRRRYGRIG